MLISSVNFSKHSVNTFRYNYKHAQNFNINGGQLYAENQLKTSQYTKKNQILFDFSNVNTHKRFF